MGLTHPRVQGIQRRKNSGLSTDFFDALWELASLKLSETFPGRIPSKITILSIIGYLNLRSNEQNLAMEAVDSAIVPKSMLLHW